MIGKLLTLDRCDDHNFLQAGNMLADYCSTKEIQAQVSDTVACLLSCVSEDGYTIDMIDELVEIYETCWQVMKDIAPETFQNIGSYNLWKKIISGEISEVYIMYDDDKGIPNITYVNILEVDSFEMLYGVLYDARRQTPLLLKT